MPKRKAAAPDLFSLSTGYADNPGENAIENLFGTIDSFYRRARILRPDLTFDVWHTRVMQYHKDRSQYKRDRLIHSLYESGSLTVPQIVERVNAEADREGWRSLDDESGRRTITKAYENYCDLIGAIPIVRQGGRPTKT